MKQSILKPLSIQEARGQLPPGFCLTRNYCNKQYVATNSELGVIVLDSDIEKVISKAAKAFVAFNTKSKKSAKYGSLAVDPEAVDFQSIEQTKLISTELTTEQHNYHD